MQHVRIIHPLCYLGQEPIMSDVVKVAAQIDVYDTCFLLNNCSGYPVDRFMRCPLGTISKRSRLEVRLEDRLQYELERPLHHAIPNCRNRKYADFVPVLRYFLPSGWERCICALLEFVRYLFEESVYALRFDGREGYPIYSRNPFVLFGQRIRSSQRFHLADVDVQTPEPPGRISSLPVGIRRQARCP